MGNTESMCENQKYTHSQIFKDPDDQQKSNYYMKTYKQMQDQFTQYSSIKSIKMKQELSKQSQLSKYNHNRTQSETTLNTSNVNNNFTETDTKTLQNDMPTAQTGQIIKNVIYTQKSPLIRNVRYQYSYQNQNQHNVDNAANVITTENEVQQKTLPRSQREVGQIHQNFAQQNQSQVKNTSPNSQSLNMQHKRNELGNSNSYKTDVNSIIKNNSFATTHQKRPKYANSYNEWSNSTKRPIADSPGQIKQRIPTYNSVSNEEVRSYNNATYNNQNQDAIISSLERERASLLEPHEIFIQVCISKEKMLNYPEQNKLFDLLNSLDVTNFRETPNQIRFSILRTEIQDNQELQRYLSDARFLDMLYDHSYNVKKNIKYKQQQNINTANLLHHHSQVNSAQEKEREFNDFNNGIDLQQIIQKAKLEQQQEKISLQQKQEKMQLQQQQQQQQEHSNDAAEGGGSIVDFNLSQSIMDEMGVVQKAFSKNNLLVDIINKSNLESMRSKQNTFETAQFQNGKFKIQNSNFLLKKQILQKQQLQNGLEQKEQAQKAPLTPQIIKNAIFKSSVNSTPGQSQISFEKRQKAHTSDRKSNKTEGNYMQVSQLQKNATQSISNIQPYQDYDCPIPSIHYLVTNQSHKNEKTEFQTADFSKQQIATLQEQQNSTQTQNVNQSAQQQFINTKRKLQIAKQFIKQSPKLDKQEEDISKQMQGIELNFDFNKENVQQSDSINFYQEALSDIRQLNKSFQTKQCFKKKSQNLEVASKLAFIERLLTRMQENELQHQHHIIDQRDLIKKQNQYPSNMAVNNINDPEAQSKSKEAINTIMRAAEKLNNLYRITISKLQELFAKIEINNFNRALNIQNNNNNQHNNKNDNMQLQRNLEEKQKAYVVLNQLEMEMIQCVKVIESIDDNFNQGTTYIDQQLGMDSEFMANIHSILKLIALLREDIEQQEHNKAQYLETFGHSTGETLQQEHGQQMLYQQYSIDNAQSSSELEKYNKQYSSNDSVNASSFKNAKGLISIITSQSQLLKNIKIDGEEQ